MKKPFLDLLKVGMVVHKTVTMRPGLLWKEMGNRLLSHCDTPSDGHLYGQASLPSCPCE